MAGPGAPDGGFRVAVTEAAAVVSTPAEIDASNAGLLRQVIEAAVRERPVVVVDLAGNEFCDSSAILALVMGRKQAETAGSEVRLVMGGPAVRRIFKSTGVDGVFPVFATLPDALAGPGRPDT
jgi:anti-sigma B factor antagonist